MLPLTAAIESRKQRSWTTNMVVAIDLEDGKDQKLLEKTGSLSKTESVMEISSVK